MIDYLKNSKGLMCPQCRSENFDANGSLEEGSIKCISCLQIYIVKNQVASLVNKESDNYKSKKEITDFWQHLYHAAYKKHDQLDDKSSFIEQLDLLEALLLHRQHLAVTEMPILSLKDKKILEIGSGAGAHSSLFCYKGANVTALDITLDRAYATSKKLNILTDFKTSFAIHGDGEALPFKDNYFDIVYSNGVLHHTHDTLKAIDEVYRVMKPGGEAVIMLYSKHSFLYWINLFLMKGILLGNIFRSKQWLGRTTEWMSDDKQEIYNPETKVFSHKELRKIFKKYNSVKIRKAGFIFDQIPLIGKIIAKIIGNYTNYNEAGVLIYDKPWRNESKIELFLSRFIGFANNIKARK